MSNHQKNPPVLLALIVATLISTGCSIPRCGKSCQLKLPRLQAPQKLRINAPKLNLPKLGCFKCRVGKWFGRRNGCDCEQSTLTSPYNLPENFQVSETIEAPVESVPQEFTQQYEQLPFVDQSQIAQPETYMPTMPLQPAGQPVQELSAPLELEIPSSPQSNPLLDDQTSIPVMPATDLETKADQGLASLNENTTDAFEVPSEPITSPKVKLAVEKKPEIDAEAVETESETVVNQKSPSVALDEETDSNPYYPLPDREQNFETQATNEFVSREDPLRVLDRDESPIPSADVADQVHDKLQEAELVATTQPQVPQAAENKEDVFGAIRFPRLPSELQIQPQISLASSQRVGTVVPVRQIRQTKNQPEVQPEIVRRRQPVQSFEPSVRLPVQQLAQANPDLAPVQTQSPTQIEAPAQNEAPAQIVLKAFASDELTEPYRKSTVLRNVSTGSRSPAKLIDLGEVNFQIRPLPSQNTGSTIADSSDMYQFSSVPDFKVPTLRAVQETQGDNSLLKIQTEDDNQFRPGQFELRSINDVPSIEPIRQFHGFEFESIRGMSQRPASGTIR